MSLSKQIHPQVLEEKCAATLEDSLSLILQDFLSLSHVQASSSLKVIAKYFHVGSVSPPQLSQLPSITLVPQEACLFMEPDLVCFMD